MLYLSSGSAVAPWLARWSMSEIQCNCVPALIEHFFLHHLNLTQTLFIENFYPISQFLYYLFYYDYDFLNWTLKMQLVLFIIYIFSKCHVDFFHIFDFGERVAASF